MRPCPQHSNEITTGLGLWVWLTFLVVVLAAAVLGPGRTSAQEVVPLRPTGPVQGQYIVVFHDDVANPRGVANALTRQLGVRPRHVYQSAIKGFAAQMPAPVAELLMNDPNVAYVEIDKHLHAVAQALPAGVDRVDADVNAFASIDGVDDRVDVDVAMIDSGIASPSDPHPDLNVVRWETFTTSDGVNPDNIIDDLNGHGTFTAGVVGALDNGSHVVGVAPGVRLWSLRVLGQNGSGFISDIVAAVDFVTANAADIEVANMSLGGQTFSSALHTSIDNAVAAGVVVVVAAGNAGADILGANGVLDTSASFSCLLLGRNCPDDYIPAAYPSAATISGMGDTDGVAGGLGPNTSGGTGDDTFYASTNFANNDVSGNPVSSTGAAIDLAAPGVDVLSTYPTYLDADGLATGTGTSASAPHAAGAVALYIAANGRANDAAGVHAIRQALIDAGEPQSQWGPASTNDPDSNPERLVDASGSSINQAPNVSITLPDADPASFNSGETIDFAGTALDNEDGDISANLVWTSSIDGPLNGGQASAGFSTTLSDGTHTITADVTDSGGEPGSDSTTVIVGTPNDPPVVNITLPDADPASFNSGETVDFAGTALDNEDGDISANLVWTSSIDGPLNGGQASASFSTTLSDGTHTITADVTDSGGEPGSDSTTVIVGAAPNTVHVTSPDGSNGYATEGGRDGTKHLFVTVALEDGAGAPVADASVSVSITGPKSGTGTGTTDALGEVTFSLKNAPSGTYTTNVTDVTASGLTWDGVTPPNSFLKP